MLCFRVCESMVELQTCLIFFKISFCLNFVKVGLIFWVMIGWEVENLKVFFILYFFIFIDLKNVWFDFDFSFWKTILWKLAIQTWALFFSKRGLGLLVVLYLERDERLELWGLWKMVADIKYSLKLFIIGFLLILVVNSQGFKNC